MYGFLILELFRKSWIPDTWKNIRFPFFPFFSVMTAAGSLFTSCIEQVEPEGIRDMRIAKAEFIRSLKDLNTAKGELLRAKAAVEQANAAYTAAQTAWESEYNKMVNEGLRLQNEAQAAQNEQDAARIAKQIAEWEMELEKAQKQHEIDMAIKEQEILNELENLRKAQRDIELKAQDLTKEEKEALVAAAGAYYATVAAIAKENMKIAQLKAELDVFKAQEGNGQMWDEDSRQYVAYIEYYENQIAAAEARIANNKKKIENNSKKIEDVEAWAAEIKAYEKEMAELEYSKKDLTMADANYYVTYVHDGIKKYNAAIDEFTAKYGTDPSVAPSRLDTLWKENGAPKAADFVVGYAESIKTPALENKGTPAYSKFFNMLSTYRNRYWNDVAILTLGTDEEGNFGYMINAQQSMKEFVMGDENGDKGSQKLTEIIKNNRRIEDYDEAEYKNGTRLVIERAYDTTKINMLAADYGLRGALSVLNRDMVLSETEQPDVEAAKILMDSLQGVWNDHRTTLIDGLTKYDPYTKAIDNYTAAVTAFNAAVAQDKKDAEAVGAAIEEWNVLLESLSTKRIAKITSELEAGAVFDAIIKLAENRAKLDYEPDYSNGYVENKDYFYYATKEEKGKPVVDSIEFVKLNRQMALVKSDATKDTYSDYAYDDKTAEPYVISDCPNAYIGLVRIVDQFFGRNGSNFSQDCDVNNTLYGKYEFVKAEGEKGKTGYKAATIAPLGGGTYSSVATNDAKIDLNSDDKKSDGKTKGLNARAAVIDSVAKFYDVYKAFWYDEEVEFVKATVEGYFKGTGKYFDLVEKADSKAADIAKAKTNAEKEIAAILKYDPKCYTEETFTEPFNIVSFNEMNLAYSSAITVILGSVDPMSKGADAYWGTSAIFGELYADHGDKEDNLYYEDGRNTDFYNYMMAAWDYALAQNPISVDIDDITAWVDAVEAAFEADAKAAAEPDADLLAEATDRYNKAIERFEHNEEFSAAWVEFVGVDEDGELLGYEKIDETINENNWKENFPFVEETATGIITGAWDTMKVGGQLLKNLDEFFPELPATVKELTESLTEINDLIEHQEILINAAKDAYFLAAQAAQYDKDSADWDELKKAYDKVVKGEENRLKGLITDDQDAIKGYAKTIADRKAGIDEYTIEIANKEAEIAKVEMVLAALEKAQALAKANYDKVMEYIQAQDFGFINFADIYDVIDEMLDKMPEVKSAVENLFRSLLNNI